MIRTRSLVRHSFLAALLLAAFTAGAGGVALRTLDGEDTGLGAVLSEDKWTLVMVWTTYCGVCREQYPVISEFHTRHADEDAVVVGIALDGYAKAEKVARYREEKQHSFPSLLAEAEEFGTKYALTTGVDFTGTPTYLLFDPDRRLRAYLDGPVTRDALEGYLARQ